MVTSSAGDAVKSASAMSISIKDTVVGIVPSDVITPFLKSNMLQVIFIDMIFGISVSTLGNEHRILKSLIISGSAVFSLFVAILLLSIGAPGVPGGSFICIAFLLPQIGIPAEAISLIMGLYPLVEMGQTASNSTGDAVVTAIVSKSENMIDLEKFNGN